MGNEELINQELRRVNEQEMARSSFTRQEMLEALENASSALTEPCNALDSALIDFFADEKMLSAVVSDNRQALGELMMPIFQSALLQAGARKNDVMGRVDILLAEIADLAV